MTTIKVDGLSIMGGNSKMGHVMHINLPPPMTCDHDLPCYKDGCYAMKFYRLRTQVRKCWDGNWDVLQRDRHRYFEIIADAVKLAKPKMFRWHAAGDIVDLNYLFRMEAVAYQFPDTKFMCFTKKLNFVLDADRMSTGMARPIKYVLSGWPKFDIPNVLRKAHPTAWMRDKKNVDPNIPKDAMPCPGGCDTCGLCWAMKPGQSVQYDRH